MGLDGINKSETVSYGGVTFNSADVASYKKDRWGIHSVTLTDGAILRFKDQTRNGAHVGESVGYRELYKLMGFEYTGSQEEIDHVVVRDCFGGTVDVSDSNPYPEPPTEENWDYGDGSEAQFEDIVLNEESMFIDVKKDNHDF